MNLLKSCEIIRAKTLRKTMSSTKNRKCSPAFSLSFKIYCRDIAFFFVVDGFSILNEKLKTLKDL